jgi:hypothetical protein
MTGFADRAARLAQVVDGLDLAADFPLLKAVRLRPELLARIRNAVNLYLYATLDSWYRGRAFVLQDELLDTASDDVRGLPNITPNGLLLPKRQNYLAYNMVHAIVVDIFESIGLSSQVATAHAPINLRLVDGRGQAQFDRRPRASVKWHSDMWAGEPAAAIIVFLPVFGVPGTLGVRWIEPREFPRELARPLDDFTEGARLIEGGREYQVAFDPGVVLLSDPYVVHATQRDTDGLRLSIDFRFISRFPIASDEVAPGTRGENYLPYADWSDIGNGRVLTTDAPLELYRGPDAANTNEYAAPFSIRRVND